MSYDLCLYRKDGSKEPLCESFVKSKLNNISDGQLTINNYSFEISGKDEQGFYNDEYFYQGEDKGYYWTYCSYGVDQKSFNILLNRICKVAKEMELLILDPQLTDTRLFTPDEYFNKPECKNNFSLIRNFSKESMSELFFNRYLIEKTQKEKFILYFISSKEPSANKEVFLSPGENRDCASKINIGQVMEDIISEDIFDFTGSREYKLYKIIKNYDAIPKRNGEILQRDALFVQVPFFDPKNIKTKFPMIWSFTS